MRAALKADISDWRWLLRVAAPVALLLLVMGVAAVILFNHAYRSEKAAELDMQADILAASVTAALDFGDPEAVEEYLNALRANPLIEAAAVYDRHGVLVRGYRNIGPPAPVNTSLIEPQEDGQSIAVTSPVMHQKTPIGTVYLRATLEPGHRRLARYGLLALLAGMTSLVLAVLAVSTAALRRANRELKDRATSLSEMNQRLETQIEERARAEEALRQAQKMQALGQLTGGIAHDFNNLLTVIQGSVDLLKRPNLAVEKRVRYIEAISQTAMRAAALTSQLLAFARRQPLQPKVIDINARLMSMLDLLQRSLGGTILVQTDLAETICPIEVDPTQLEVAILNAAVNARDAMPTGGILTISTAMVPADVDQPAQVAITVADTGTGIPPDVVERVFEPFFTTKGVGKGTGLGLSQLYGFATQSGGDVLIDSVVDEGTRITILLPCSSRTIEAAPPDKAEAVNRTGTVLLVEDNDDVATFAEALLIELGHKVVRVPSADDALAYLDQGGEVDVVFTDIIMAGKTGLELAAILKETRPDLPILLTTGYSHQVAEAGSSGLPVLLKPYRLDEISAALTDVLARAGKR